MVLPRRLGLSGLGLWEQALATFSPFDVWWDLATNQSQRCRRVCASTLAVCADRQWVISVAATPSSRLGELLSSRPQGQSSKKEGATCHLERHPPPIFVGILLLVRVRHWNDTRLFLVTMKGRFEEVFAGRHVAIGKQISGLHAALDL